jgi:hypothetical protein
MPDSRVRGSGPRAVFGGTFGTLCRTASSSDDGEVITSGKTAVPELMLLVAIRAVAAGLNSWSGG